MSERHERGRRAEALVVSHLESLGYEILGRNVRVGSLEVDVLARKGPVVALVEVRARSWRARHSAAESVTSVKRKRLRTAAALLWSHRLSKIPGVERVRFDVAAVLVARDGSWPLDYFEAAFV